MAIVFDEKVIAKLMKRLRRKEPDFWREQALPGRKSRPLSHPEHIDPQPAARGSPDVAERPMTPFVMNEYIDAMNQDIDKQQAGTSGKDIWKNSNDYMGVDGAGKSRRGFPITDNSWMNWVHGQIQQGNKLDIDKFREHIGQDTVRVFTSRWIWDPKGGEVKYPTYTVPASGEHYGDQERYYIITPGDITRMNKDMNKVFMNYSVPDTRSAATPYGTRTTSVQGLYGRDHQGTVLNDQGSVVKFIKNISEVRHMGTLFMQTRVTANVLGTMKNGWVREIDPDGEYVIVDFGDHTEKYSKEDIFRHNSLHIRAPNGAKKVEFVKGQYKAEDFKHNYTDRDITERIDALDDLGDSMYGDTWNEKDVYTAFLHESPNDWEAIIRNANNMGITGFNATVKYDSNGEPYLEFDGAHQTYTIPLINLPGESADPSWGRRRGEVPSDAGAPKNYEGWYKGKKEGIYYEVGTDKGGGYHMINEYKLENGKLGEPAGLGEYDMEAWIAKNTEGGILTGRPEETAPTGDPAGIIGREYTDDNGNTRRVLSYNNETGYYTMGNSQGRTWSLASLSELNNLVKTGGWTIPSRGGRHLAHTSTNLDPLRHWRGKQELGGAHEVYNAGDWKYFDENDGIWYNEKLNLSLNHDEMSSRFGKGWENTAQNADASQYDIMRASDNWKSDGEGHLVNNDGEILGPDALNDRFGVGGWGTLETPGTPTTETEKDSDDG